MRGLHPRIFRRQACFVRTPVRTRIGHTGNPRSILKRVFNEFVMGCTSVRNRKQCQKCPKGFYSNSTIEGNANCEQCPAGLFQAEQNVASYVLVVPLNFCRCNTALAFSLGGVFSIWWQATACTKCLAGTTKLASPPYYAVCHCSRFVQAATGHSSIASVTNMVGTAYVALHL